jgi:hypothetical protein
VGAYNAWRPSVDFTGPIDAETSALLPQLHQTLVRLELDDPLMAIFAGISRRAWYENQLLLASLRQLLEALTNERIDCVLVGEVPLVLNYFESHKPRRIERLDIVVSSAAAQQAARLLNAAGWVSARPLAEEEIAYNHMKRFTGPNARILDLHWHFVGSAARASVDEFFWAARQTSNLQEVGACYLSPAAMLLHSLLDDHSLLASMPARWVADELALIAGTANAIDWNQIVAFALEEKLASRLRRKLELLKRFGAPIPNTAMIRLRDGQASLPESADRLVLNSLPRKLKFIPLGGRGVFADYLRADRRVLRGPVDFSHFVRHRWGLKGRREIPSLAARGIWRSLVSFM